MRVNVSTNEKFNRIEIVKNDNNGNYQISIDGEQFTFDCKKCGNIKLGFDIFENGKIKILESDGNKS